MANLPDREDTNAASFALILRFLEGSSLTARIAELENQLDGATGHEASALTEASAISPAMLDAALTVRSAFGRINDIIHAAVIGLALPHVMEPGERITNRPSLGAGNDPSRPYDLETDRRVAEFKVSVWTGRDAMRKRGVFADLAHLAMDQSGRRRQLFVVGHQPDHFLRSTMSTAGWGLARGSDDLRTRFVERFGSLGMPISEFRANEAEEVEIIDLATVLPAIAQLLDRLT